MTSGRFMFVDHVVEDEDTVFKTLCMTGFTRDKALSEGMESGGPQMIIKPFSRHVVAFAVRNALDNQ